MVQRMAYIPLEDIAKVIGEDNVQLLIDTFTGDKTYFRRTFMNIQSRNKAIMDDYYSNNADRRKLAKKYGLSIGRIDQIIKEEAEQRMNKHKI